MKKRAVIASVLAFILIATFFLRTDEERQRNARKDEVLSVFQTLWALESDKVNATTTEYDDMVTYLMECGALPKDVTPVDINRTDGYFVSEDGSSDALSVADKAYDYGGIYILWWDLKNPNEETTPYYVDYFSNVHFLDAPEGRSFTMMGSGSYIIIYTDEVETERAATLDETFSSLENCNNIEYLTDVNVIFGELYLAGVIESSDFESRWDWNGDYEANGEPVILASQAIQIKDIVIFYFDEVGLYGGLDHNNLEQVYQDVRETNTLIPYYQNASGEWLPFTYTGSWFDPAGDVLEIKLDGVYGRFAVYVI